MAQVDTGGAKTSGPRKRRKPQPVSTAPPPQADTGDVARARPAPRTVTAPAFRPRLSTVPFARQQAAATRTVRATTRQLPAPALAAPPIISGGPSAGGQGKPMTRAQVNAFLNSRAKVTQAARVQIVNSIRTQVSDSHGQERVDRITGLMDEIATNPKLAHTRKAIRYYTALEQETARPNRDEARPGKAHPLLSVEPTKAGIPLPKIDLTAASRTAAKVAETVAPGLKGATPSQNLVRNAIKDVGIIATAPFVGAYHSASANIADIGDVASGRPLGEVLTQGRTAGILTGVGKGIAHEASHPVESFKKHPLLTALDVSAAGAVIGHGVGAVTRAVGSTTDAAGIRGAAARAGSTVRSPLAHSDDPAGGFQQRTGSKDSIRKMGQVIADKMREPVRNADGSIKTVTDRGRTVPVLKSHDRPTVRHPFGERNAALNAEADFAASRANSVERLVRDEANREMRARGVKGRKAKDLVAMVVEGTITSANHFMDDLRAERDRIRGHLDEYERQVAQGVPKDERIYRHSDEVAAAHDRLAMVDNALTHPKIGSQAAAIVDAGVEIGRKLNEQERKAVALGILHGGRAKRARLSTTALAHQDARYYREPELQALERAGFPVRDPQALARHQAADAAHTAAERRHGDTQETVRKLANERKKLVGAQASRRGTRAQEDARFRAAADQGIAQVQTRIGDLEKRLGELEKSMTSASNRGDAGRMHEIQGHIEVLNDNLVHARTQLGKLRDQRARFTGTAKASKAEEAKLTRVTALLKQARRQEKQAYHEFRNARRDLVKTPKPPIREALRGPNGRFLANSDIEDFLRSRGRDPDTVAYLPHRQAGSGAFHQQHRPGARSNMDTGEVRTGSAYLKGVTQSSAEQIRAQGVRQRVQIAKAEALDKMIRDQGMKHPSGSYYTAKEGLEVADRLFTDTGERLVPVRAFAAKLDPETRRMIREDLQGPGAMDSLGSRLLNDRVITKGIEGDKGARNVVLVPGQYIDRLNRHLRPTGEIGKLLQAMNRPFRFAVLATPKWLTGQFVEPYLIRLTVNGSGLNVFGLGLDIAASTRMLRRAAKSADPRTRKAAEELVGHQLGGLAIGGRGLSNRRTAEEFGLYGQMVAKLPVVAQGFDMVRALGRVLMKPGNAFFKINRAIENVAQRAALGRDVRRDIQAFTGSWIKTLRLQKRALDEAMRGLVDTPTQRRFMTSQHEMLGKYEGYPPWLRNLIQGPMPFIPWVLNSARFTLWTMPAHHTALTAYLIKVNDVMAKDWEDLHKGTPPGSLRFAVPTKDGGWIDLARYGPYGLTTGIVGSEGKNWEAVTDQFLPQFGGALAALAHGEDPFGRALQIDPRENNGNTEPNFGQRLGIALYGMGESSIPYVGQTRRILEGGETGYAGSTILDRDTKPGTAHGRTGLGRTLNPLEPIYLNARGAGRPISTRSTSAPTGPLTPAQRRQQMLLKRAARTSRLSTAAARRQQMLLRRAARQR